MNWEQEKVYCKKRAKELKTEMEAATAASNEERFIKAYQTAIRIYTSSWKNLIQRAKPTLTFRKS